jgi:hypothetical protein
MAFFDFVSPLKGATGNLPWYFEGLSFWINSDSADIVSVDLTTGNNGITGRFVQRWTSSNEDGVYNVPSTVGTARNEAPSDLNLDTHLLLNPGTSISDEAEGLGTNPTTPGAGQQFGPFPTNTLAVGYSQTGTDGFLKGMITVNQPGVRALEVAFAVDAFYDVNYMLFNADVTTTSGTTHVSTQYIPEPQGFAALGVCAIGMACRRRGTSELNPGIFRIRRADPA